MGGLGGSAGTGQGPSSFNGLAGQNGVARGQALFTNGNTVGISVDSGSITYANSISGSGPVGGDTILKTGAGELVLTGANDFTGTVEIAGGTLTVNANNGLGNVNNAVHLNNGTLGASITGTLTMARDFTIAGSGTINVGPAGTLTLSHAIADGVSSGNLVKDGAGTLILTAAETYSGSTLINAGTLQLNTGASLNPVTNVALGDAGTFDLKVRTTVAAVSGTGTIVMNAGNLAVTNVAGPNTAPLSTLSVQSGGIVRAGSGSGTGTLTVNGNAQFASGSTLQTNVNGGTADKLSVSGAVSLSSGSTLTAGGTGVIGQKYDLVHAAAGLSGTFSSFVYDFAGTNAYLTYGANDVFLILGIIPFAPLALNSNERNVGLALDGASSSPAATALLTEFFWRLTYSQSSA